MMEHLSELEKQLCTRLTRVQVVGKCAYSAYKRVIKCVVS